MRNSRSLAGLVCLVCAVFVVGLVTGCKDTQKQGPAAGPPIQAEPGPRVEQPVSPMGTGLLVIKAADDSQPVVEVIVSHSYVEWSYGDVAKAGMRIELEASAYEWTITLKAEGYRTQTRFVKIDRRQTRTIRYQMKKF